MKKKHTLTAANAKLKSLRKLGWKPGMDKQFFQENYVYSDFACPLERIAEIVFHEGLTDYRVSNAAIAAIIGRTLRKIRSDVDYEF